MGLLVDRLYLDVGLTQRDPAATWKQNTGEVEYSWTLAPPLVCFHELEERVQRAPTSTWWRGSWGCLILLSFGLVVSISTQIS